MSAVDWATVENALHLWVSRGSSLAETSVIWWLTGGPRPPAPYILLSLPEFKSVGHDWIVKKAAPEPVTPYEEIVRVARGMRTARLEMQCFAVEGTSSAALSILSDVMASLQLHISNLDDAGVGIGVLGPLQPLSGRRNGILEPRATWSLGLHLASEVQDFVTYIQSIDLSVTEASTGSTQSITIERPET